jgi:ParB family chromosome partitioning protein
MSRKALGRGLNALLREPEPPQGSSRADEIPTDLIDPNPFQPRQSFSEQALKELADSIRASGVVQPILVRRSGDRYQIVAGERRWRGAMLAQLERVPAIVRDFDDAQALEIALTENLMREDLNPVEVARGYAQLQSKFGLTHEQIAQRLGVSRPAVSNALRILEMDPEVQRLVAEGKLSGGHARALAGIASHETQRRLANLAAQRGMSVRQMELLAASTFTATKRTDTQEHRVDPNVRAAILDIERTLGTRVKLFGNANRGRIEISYFSADDLNRIFSIIVRST